MSTLRIALIIGLVAGALIAVYYGLLRQRVLRVEDTRHEVVIAVALLTVSLVSLVTALVILISTALAHRPAPAALTASGVGGLTAALLVLMVVLSQATAYTPSIDGDRSIAELRAVEVNGRTEWLSIRGQDRRNPVVLFLAGGPGGSQLVTARHGFADLEKDYVVVNWDQPGAAKSYGAITPRDITLDTYLADGAAITELLRTEFNQDQIYLMGESWGSALGLLMAKEHPEYYAAFIGTGQMVDFLETEKIGYAMALDDARARGDEVLVNRLVAQGPPPYESQVALKSIVYIAPLEGATARTGQVYGSVVTPTDGPFGVEYGLWDKVNLAWGLYRTFDSFYGKLYPVDLREVAADQEVPIFIFHGRYDYSAPVSLVEDYYSLLNAPAKELIFFEHSGHSPWQTENELFLEHLRSAFDDGADRPR